MGCDIHFYVERRVDGQWTTADTWVDENDGTDEEPEITTRVPYDKRFYSGRNYNLFAILADVRNGRGFAGVQTGEGFNPIAAPKGLPEDCTALVKQTSDDWGCDAHSHSWLTVKELLDFDWTQATRSCGVVGLINFEKFDRWQRDNGSPPDGYCGGVAGPGVKHINEIEMKELAAKYRSLDGDNKSRFAKEHGMTYCQVWWGITYSRAASCFWSDTIPRLLRLGKPEDVRIVFFFDN